MKTKEFAPADQFKMDTDEDCRRILNGHDYPVKSGMLQASAQILRRAVVRLSRELKRLDPGNYQLVEAKIDLGLTEYLVRRESMMPGDAKHISQQDRVLENGKTKTATGFVEDPVCTDIRDMDGYGKEGF